jgi:hypothetical protein
MTALDGIRVFFYTLAAAVMLFVVTPPPAAADSGCDEATTGICLDQFGAIVAVEWTGSGFTAVADEDGALFLLDVSLTGEIRRRTAIDLPDWVRQSQGSIARIDKIVAGSGSALLVGSVLDASGGGQQTGLIGRIEDGGGVEWAGPITTGNGSSTILYSGVHDPASGRFIVVGRHTNGADSGKCAFWSQGYLTVFPESGPLRSISQIFYGKRAPGPTNRIAFYDIAAAEDGTGYAVVGFATAPRRGGGCQDDMLAMELRSEPDGDWRIGVSHRLGSDDGDEVAFDVARHRGDRFTVVGYGIEPRGKARAAVAAAFALDGSPPDIRYHAYPEDDDSGGDRYRAVVPIDGGERILVAGSASESRSARNQGLWRLLGGSLKEDGPATFLTIGTGSDILAAAAAPDGRVLAAGAHRKGEDTSAWLGVIYGAVEIAGRRAPDQNLSRLTAAELTQGHVKFSEREFRGGAGYFTADVAEGTVFETQLAFSEPTQLAVSALTGEGDIDLMLLDEDETLIAFSTNLGNAGEYMRAWVEPGEYRVRVIAASAIDAYEFRARLASPEEQEVIASLMALDPGSRKALDRLLASGGYGHTANPDIGFGSGAARSVLALANTVQADLSGGALAQFIVSAAASVAE